MISAQKAEIEQVSCNNDILSITFGKNTGPQLHRSVSTNSSLGNMPFVHDPYEARMVNVGSSDIENLDLLFVYGYRQYLATIMR